MSKNRGPITTWAQYLAARLAAMALMMFDVETNQHTASQVGRGLYAIDKHHRRRALESIRWAFPEFSDTKVEWVALRSFEHFVTLAAEVCFMPRKLHYETFTQCVAMNKLGRCNELLNARQSVIVLSGHVGNWEVLGSMLGAGGYDLAAIARPIDNPLVNDWLMGIREAKGMHVITKWGATDRMLNTLARGGALAFIADQNAGEKGLFVPFFGRLASTYKSIGLLAMNQNVPIICGYTHRIGPGFHFETGETDVIFPHEWHDQPDPLYYITARYTRAIEAMVRIRPEQYLWMHRRWKSRPRHERLGRPMPTKLQRNLEQLPWMDQAQLDPLLHPQLQS